MKTTGERAGAWALAIHGGAKEIAPEDEAANRVGCARALAAGRTVLAYGGSAVAAVEAAVRVLEDDPSFNAGYGSVPNAAGDVEMCAALMDGSDLSIGAVGIIRGVRNPVTIARMVREVRPVLLAGEGAREFARTRGAALCDPSELIANSQGSFAGHDTVGAVALDLAGNLAAATSTGGLSGTPPGRMGDSALPGCGYYADNAVGGVALSGDGEAIARLAAAASIICWMPALGPERALAQTLKRLPALDGDGGGIAIAADGTIGWWHNSPHFAVGVASGASPDGAVWLHKDEA
jgi:beta-aspartyl-peptidase (threonine type)